MSYVRNCRVAGLYRFRGRKGSSDKLSHPWILVLVRVPPPGPVVPLVAAAAIAFTAGVVVGAFVHYGWGWGHWGCGWGPHPFVAYNHVTYVSRSVTVVGDVLNVRCVLDCSTGDNRVQSTWCARLRSLWLRGPGLQE
jgi:hypothetical protein